MNDRSELKGHSAGARDGVHGWQRGPAGLCVPVSSPSAVAGAWLPCRIGALAGATHLAVRAGAEPAATVFRGRAPLGWPR